MTKVILAADINLESSQRQQAIDTYKALLRGGIHAYFLRTADQSRIIKDENVPSLAIDEITHSAIIVMRELHAFAHIDHTNVLIWMASSGVIDDYMIFMIHRIDKIIAPSYDIAFKLSATLQKMDLFIPVHRVQPWIDQSNCKISAGHTKLKVVVRGPFDIVSSIDNVWDFELYYIGDKPIAGWNNISSVDDWSDYDVFVNLNNGYDSEVRTAMMSGVIPMVYDRLPFNEYIIHRVNGYKIVNIDDMVDSFTHLSANSNFRAIKSIVIASAYSMSPEEWAKSLVRAIFGSNTENVNNDNLFADVPISYRRWIVPKVILRGGREVMVPRYYNHNRFTIIKLNTVKEILTYFVAQKFMDVYIFHWEYDNIDSDGRNEILNLSRAIGRRGLNMYWCTDSAIPKEWGEVFKQMTVLSTADGLKKVKPPVSSDTRRIIQRQT